MCVCYRLRSATTRSCCRCCCSNCTAQPHLQVPGARLLPLLLAEVVVEVVVVVQQRLVRVQGLVLRVRPSGKGQQG